MNPAVALLNLRQGNVPIETYLAEFCELSHQLDFNDVALKDIFRVNLNEPIRSQLPGGNIHWSLAQYIDYALLLSGSSFTVGFEEKPHKPTVSAKPEPLHVMPAKPEPLHVMPAKPEPLHVMSAKPAKPEFLHVMPAKPESLHVMSAKPEYLHLMSAKPESLHVMSAKPESLHVMSAMSESVHATSAAEPVSPDKMAAAEPVSPDKMAAAEPVSPDKMAAAEPVSPDKMATAEPVSPDKMAATEPVSPDKMAAATPEPEPSVMATLTIMATAIWCVWSVHTFDVHVTSAEPETELHVTSAEPETELHVTSAEAETELHVTSAEPEAELHVTSAEPEAELHVTSAEPEAELHVTSAEPETELHVTSAEPETELHVTSAEPETELHVTSAEPETELHVTSAEPEPVHVTSAEPQPVHVTSAEPEPVHVTTAETFHVISVLESLSVPAHNPIAVPKKILGGGAVGSLIGPWRPCRHGHLNCLVHPGHLNCLVHHGHLNCLVHPGLQHSRIRPGFLHCRIRPGFLHCRIRPGFLHCRIRPGFLHCRIRPRLATAQVRPRLATAQVRPRLATAQVRPRLATAQVRPRHATTQARPRHATSHVLSPCTGLAHHPSPMTSSTPPPSWSSLVFWFCWASGDALRGGGFCHVLVAPKISSSCNKSSVITCVCEAHGNPSPKLEWRRSGNVLTNSTETLIRNETLGSTSSKSILTIHQPLTDTGVLQCFSANTLGTASASERFHPVTETRELFLQDSNEIKWRPNGNFSPEKCAHICQDTKATDSHGDGECVYGNKDMLSAVTPRSPESLHYSTIDFTNAEPALGEIRGASSLTEEYSEIRHHSAGDAASATDLKEDQSPQDSSAKIPDVSSEDTIYESMTRRLVV
ncbi:hypothetical protein PO909_028607 [Leuciscus waleckii]